MLVNEPWVLSALYSGNVFIWNYDSQTLVKQFEVVEANTPVRCAKFIARQQWFVCGSDDYHVRCFNYNTGDKVTAFKALTDYLRWRYTQHPYILTSSDDMSIKLWDWSKGWQNTQIFEGHSHYVMPSSIPKIQTLSRRRRLIIWSKSLAAQRPTSP